MTLECPANYVCKYDIHPLGYDVLLAVVVVVVILAIAAFLVLAARDDR